MLYKYTPSYICVIKENNTFCLILCAFTIFFLFVCNKCSNDFALMQQNIIIYTHNMYIVRETEKKLLLTYYNIYKS